MVAGAAVPVAGQQPDVREAGTKTGADGRYTSSHYEAGPSNNSGVAGRIPTSQCSGGSHCSIRQGQVTLLSSMVPAMYFSPVWRNQVLWQGAAAY